MVTKTVKARFLALGIFSAIAVTPLIFVEQPGRTQLPSTQEPPTLVPPGAKIEGDEIVFPDGARLSRDAGNSLSSNDCPSGWVCLYERDQFRGRRLRWSDPGTRIRNLTDYGFNDQMTSWWNRSRFDARWFFNAQGNFQDLSRSRCMNANTRVSNVGRNDNDDASALAIYTDNRAC